MGANDFDIYNLLNGFRVKETKTEVTNKYIQGTINKEEFIRRMKDAED